MEEGWEEADCFLKDEKNGEKGRNLGGVLVKFTISIHLYSSSLSQDS